MRKISKQPLSIILGDIVDSFQIVAPSASYLSSLNELLASRTIILDSVEYTLAGIDFDLNVHLITKSHSQRGVLLCDAKAILHSFANNTCHEK